MGPAKYIITTRGSLAQRGPFLYCARRCRLLGASVGAISSLCDAAVSGAHRAQLLCARGGYLVGRSRSAALRQRYSGRPPGRRSPPALAPAGPGKPRAEGRQFRARDCRWACGAGRTTIGRPPRLPPEAWSRSCLKRRPDPARRPRPRPGGSRVTALGRTKRTSPNLNPSPNPSPNPNQVRAEWPGRLPRATVPGAPTTRSQPSTARRPRASGACTAPAPRSPRPSA